MILEAMMVLSLAGHGGDRDDDRDDDDRGRGRHDKVVVCHNGHTIEVSRRAAGRHLRDGDTLGECQDIPSGDNGDDCDDDNEGESGSGDDGDGDDPAEGEGDADNVDQDDGLDDKYISGSSCADNCNAGAALPAVGLAGLLLAVRRRKKS